MTDEASFFSQESGRLNWQVDWRSFIGKNKLVVALAMIGILLLSFGVLFFIAFSSKEQTQVEIISSLPSASPALKPIFIHVAGAVETPGLYQLPSDSRVNDALIASGGLSAEADRDWVAKNLNLAQRLADGLKVYIPFKSEMIESGGLARGGVAGAQLLTGTEKININTASISQLDSLPGIGPAIAKRIVDYREANGLFNEPKEIMKVPGIGEKTFQNLSDKIIVF